MTAPGALTYPLIRRACLRRLCGAWAGAQADAQRAVRLAHELGRASDECWGLSILTWIMAAQGRLDEELAGQRVESRELLEAGRATFEALAAAAWEGHAASALARSGKASARSGAA